MRKIKFIAQNILCLGAIFVASAASAALSKVICVPWQGDITKYHTAVAQPACDTVVPMSIKFEILDTACGGNGTYVFYLNGVQIGTTPSDPTEGCTCTPPVTTFAVTDASSGGLLTANWNASGANMLRATGTANGAYVARLSADVTWADGDAFTCLLQNGGSSCTDNDLCDFAYSKSAFDVSATVNQCPSAGATTQLKAVIKTTTTDPIWYQWVYGDGTSDPTITQLSGKTKYLVQTTHNYSGAVGTPFTAQLIAADNNGLASPITSRYLIELQDNTLDSRINIAIDNGEWYLYQQGVVSDGQTSPYFTFDGAPCVAWPPNGGDSSTFYVCASASAIQAFEINGSLETGNFDQDPYAEYVHLGLHWLLQGYAYNTSYPMLQAVSIGLQHGTDNPDSNGNGIGIQAHDYSTDPIYEGGMVMDAIVASGTPNASTGRDFVGNGHIATYSDVVQDMCDMYAWGQSDSTANFTGAGGTTQNGIIGGWRYSWNADSDNSAAQWAAIGMIASQQSPWNAVVPQWVKTYDDNWLWYSFASTGQFGYTQANSYAGLGFGESTTPSGMVQLIFDGKTTSDPRWVASENWLASNWDTGANWLGRVNTYTFYSFYSFTKAMRLALPSPVITFASDGFDWYRGSTTDNGIAKTASDPLVASGHWTGGTSWEGTTLATAWAVIVLKPNLFSSGPIACFTVAPNPGFSDVPIAFNPSCSGDSQPGKTIANITKFDWAWGDGTPDTVMSTPAVVNHSFHCTSLPCSFTVTLTVTDDSNPALTATYQQVVNITQPPHPPVSNPGGPYIVSLCQSDSLTLDGSASFSPDQGLKQVGCNTCPIDTITAYGWALKTTTAFTDENTAVVNLGSGFTTFFPNPASYNIGLQVTDNAALSFPAGASVDLTGTAFTTVQVFAAGPCTLTATGGCQSVTLNWNAVQGATEYDIYSSSTGPNSGFTQIDTVAGTATGDTVAATLNQSEWYRVQAKGANGEITMSPAVNTTDTFDECTCIKNMSIAAKSLLVQLNWTPVQGASCYNVYRTTTANVALVAGNRIASCVGVSGLYVDSTVSNGTTYYYAVTEVVNGAEVCRSSVVHATPNPPARR